MCVAGLAQKPISSWVIPLGSVEPLFDDMVSQGVHNSFALQLCDVTTDTSQSGRLWIGGYDSNYTASAMQYVPLVSQDYYSVAMSGFNVNGQALSGFSQFSEGTIVDSGTTLIILKSSVRADSIQPDCLGSWEKCR
jgi:hypothetical protein